MSTSAVVLPREPQQQRGQRRVAAILEAAASVFREKGYDAATMTEVAARSGTAFGSLYRFFPSKEVLADALLLRYARLAFDRLEELKRDTAGSAPADLADRLIDMMLSLESERSFALTVANAHSERKDRLTTFRLAFEVRIADLLRARVSGLPEHRLAAVATMTLHLLRAVALLDRDIPAVGDSFMQEVRSTLRSYLSQLPQRGSRP